MGNEQKDWYADKRQSVRYIMKNSDRKLKNHTEICTNMLSFYLSSRYGTSSIGGIPEWYQIEKFIIFETRGKRALGYSDLNQIKHLIEGKSAYDLQIKQFHQELKMWVLNGWGWMPVADSVFRDAYKQRKYFRTYVKALIKIIRNAKTTSMYNVLAGYSGFTVKEKEEISQYYMNRK